MTFSSSFVTKVGVLTCLVAIGVPQRHADVTFEVYLLQQNLVALRKLYGPYVIVLLPSLWFLEYFQEKKLDKCPVACESVEFSAKLSYARYPANTYADKLLSKKRNMTGTIQENRQYLRY